MLTRLVRMRLLLWVGVAVGGFSIACGDAVTSPANENADFTMRGNVTSISFPFNSGVPSDPIAFVQVLSLTKRGDALRSGVGEARPLALSESMRVASQRSLAVMPSAQAGISGSHILSVDGAKLRHLPDVTHTSHVVTGSDGQHFDIHYLEKKGPDKEPPFAVILMKNGKPVAQSEFTYERERGRWKPSKSRSTLFDSAGHVQLVTLHDFSAVNTSLIGNVGARSVPAQFYARIGASLSRLVQPDVLYAADACGIESCVREALILAGAEAAWAGGVAAAGIALAGCAAAAIPTFGLACGPYVVAQLVLVGLDIALGVALGDYLNCKNRGTLVASISPLSGTSGPALAGAASTLQPRTATFDCSSGGGSAGDGSGSGGGSSQCGMVVWEISYDGGSTWQYWGTFWTCSAA